MNAQKLVNIKNVTNLLNSNNILLASAQEKIVQLSEKDISNIISELEQMPDIDLVQLSNAVSNSSDVITSSTGELQQSVASILESSNDDLVNAADQQFSITDVVICGWSCNGICCV